MVYRRRRLNQLLVRTVRKPAAKVVPVAIVLIKKLCDF
jgi:hypothetical protein